jgi:hypothetical protein
VNALSYFSTESSNVIDPIAELSRVSIKRPVDTPQGRLPEGSTGTVVSVYDSGAAYCVEFTVPFQTLVTVDAGALSVAR